MSENWVDTLLLKNSSVLESFNTRDIGSSGSINYPFVKYICIDDIPEEYEQIASLRDEHTVITVDCPF